MQETVAARTPAHLWIVGILSLLWSGFGAVDYMMTRMRNADWIAGMMPGVDPNAVFDWIGAFPVWASFGWGLGVWGGLAGSILLLMRSRWAVAAFGASLIGALLGLGYQIAGAPPLPGMEGPMATLMPYVIIAIALALLYYAWRQRQNGVLR